MFFVGGIVMFMDRAMLAMGNVRVDLSCQMLRSSNHSWSPGTLPPWSYPHHWPTKDSSLLRSTAEMERHSCVCDRHRTDIIALAADRISH